MPELPDVEAYVAAVQARVLDHIVRGVRLRTPFALRTVHPPLSETTGKQVRSVSRLGKRIVLGLDGELSLVIHLMIAGRLHWREPGARLASRTSVLAIDFDEGSLVLTEAGSKHRAGLWLARNVELAALHAGGIDVLAADLAAFRAALSRENRTLKRALTDPRFVDGIGNAYSDEILHAARLSPISLTSRLNDDDWQRLQEAAQRVLHDWTDRLVAEARRHFPERVTAFRLEMAVHGKFGQPCPRCGKPIQRIRYAENETNYCATCQTGGKLLADRALSRLLGEDWPRTLDELETLHRSPM